MMNTQILEYGKTVTPWNYINSLQAHAYIPQSDEKIRDLVWKHTSANKAHSVLDLGCGPKRLKIYGKNVQVYCHIDESQEFIDFAKKHSGFNSAQFVCAKFENHDLSQKFDVIFMQGVWHHIHGETRNEWMQKIYELLVDDGILIIGDEYIPDYPDEKTRKKRLLIFYAHIIAEALHGGFELLATEEAKNLIDDLSAGGDGAGVANSLLIKDIFEWSKEINDLLIDGQEKLWLQRALEIVDEIKSRTKGLAMMNEFGLQTSIVDNFYRGDFKVSMVKNIAELSRFGFNHKETFTFGPTRHIGGMGVLVFTK